MSYGIEDAITEYVNEQVSNTITEEVETALENSYVIQDIKSDLDGLLSREDEIANEVMKQIITKLASELGGYELVAKSTLDRLNQKVEELNKQLSEKKDVA
tara:strand:- start:879 stop:1181 length:303 start_codon:yes stop_codon:yes gene_type:complete